MKKKVLVIENDRDIRDIVEYVLSQEGFETLSIPEPDTMADILRFNPDLILIDEFINSKPGHRLCLKVKQEKRLSHLPVIILSTANDIELIVSECKANDYLRKPFDIEAMIEKVLKVIGNQPLPIN